LGQREGERWETVATECARCYHNQGQSRNILFTLAAADLED